MRKCHIKKEKDVLFYIHFARKNKYTISISSLKPNADDYLFMDGDTHPHAPPTTTPQNNKHLILQNGMTRILSIDTIRNIVVVESGITWEVLLKELNKIGYTLISTQSALGFSVGGSFVGNAHGRKIETPMVKDTVMSFEFIDGNGHKHSISYTQPLFHAFAGSLGLLGFISILYIRIQPSYEVIYKTKLLPYNYNAIAYIKQLCRDGDNNISMLNFRASYFPEEIPEILLIAEFITTTPATSTPQTHTKQLIDRSTTPTPAPPNNNPNRYTYTSMSYFDTYTTITPQQHQAHLSPPSVITTTPRIITIMYFSCLVVVVWFMSFFCALDATRWQIEKQMLVYLPRKDINVNVNDTYETWAQPYITNFKIIEFFFPCEDFLYCHKTILFLLHKYHMRVLSSGSRIIFERGGRGKGAGYIRFSQYATLEKPYFSLTLNFIINPLFTTALTDDIRIFILDKNIKMTYHTTYEWNFTRADIIKMYPEWGAFCELKRKYDKDELFMNLFWRMYSI